MKRKSNGKSGQKRKFSSFIFLLILCNLSFGQNFANDSIVGNNILVNIDQYKSDNAMITTLLNEVEECQELKEINAEIIQNMDLELNRRIQTERVNAAIIREKISELETETKRKKTWRKITLISMAVVLAETILIL